MGKRYKTSCNIYENLILIKYALKQKGEAIYEENLTNRCDLVWEVKKCDRVVFFLKNSSFL